MPNDTLQLFKICHVDGCARVLGKPQGRGMCGLHYNRWRLHGDPNWTRPKTIGVATCSIDGCQAIVKAMGWCVMHWTRFHRSGDPLVRWSNESLHVCQPCAREYVASGKQTRTCSLECQLAYKREYKRAAQVIRRLANPKPKVVTHYAECAYCGETFPANALRFRYCSTTCIKGDKRREYYVQRKAQLKNVEWEPFKHVEIFRRDNWVCGLCGDRIDPAVPWPNPWSASLDHVQPISLGGGHLRVNVQAAHLHCNTSKGNRTA